MEYLSIVDFLLTPVYLFIIYAVSRIIQKHKIENHPEYKYYLRALTMKILGALSLCFVYTFYYNGGDTTQYFADSISVNKLLFQNPVGGWDVIIHGLTLDKLSYFDNEIGYPVYFREASTSFVVQVISVVSILGFRSFLPSTIIIAWISFSGIWNLYRVFLIEFPKQSKDLTIAFFFIPSVLIWGSGILKDTFTLSAVGYFTYSFYKGYIKFENPIRNTIVIFISAYVIIVVKSYIFIALLPGALLWFVSNIMGKIKGKLLRYSMAPLFLFFTIGGALFIINYMGDTLGKFSSDKLLDRAVITQRDLKSDYYHGNSFDIGNFDSNFESILTVSPKALLAGLFRPYIWEANNILMVASGLENLWFLYMSILILYKTKVVGFFKFFFKHHLLTFSLVFSLFFAFSVGLTTSNFGSLVRYKIPAEPFYIASMIIINSYLKEEKKSELQLESDEDLIAA
ncbi:MAG TPA: hypothetical protein PLH61_01100 [Bacteroidia bacterium]|nr:hypothetical protein [Bacteroidia bacterium]